MKELLIIGAGSHGRVMLDICRELSISVAGFVDSTKDFGTIVDGVEVLGDDDWLFKGRNLHSYNMHVAIGDSKRRHYLAQKIIANNGQLTSLIHPSATISTNTKIGAGTAVVAGVIINTGSQIGRYCIINTGAIIDHDCILEDGIFVGPGSRLGGGVRIGKDSFLGIGTIILPNLKIYKNCTIGAGSVVTAPITDSITVKGVPARPHS